MKGQNAPFRRVIPFSETICYNFFIPAGNKMRRLQHYTNECSLRCRMTRAKEGAVMTMTEQVALAKEGDRTAFGQLYDAVAGDLYRMALYTLGNPQDAEDAVSETFLEAYKGIRNLREADAFRAWIFRILSFRCKRRVSQYILHRGEIDLDSYFESAEEATQEDSSVRAELSEVLGRLTTEEREIVLLSVLEGYTMREIAEILGLPQGTVSSKLHRTLKKMRTQLDQ